MNESNLNKVGNPNWKPGVSGNPSGRPRNLVRAAISEMKIDLVKEILIKAQELPPKQFIDVYLELLSYMQGKPKEVEPTTEELIQMLDERLPPKEDKKAA